MHRNMAIALTMAGLIATGAPAAAVVPFGRPVATAAPAPRRDATPAGAPVAAAKAPENVGLVRLFASVCGVGLIICLRRRPQVVAS